MATAHYHPTPRQCETCKNRENVCRYKFDKMPVKLTFRAPQYNTMIYQVKCTEHKAG